MIKTVQERDQMNEQKKPKKSKKKFIIISAVILLIALIIFINLQAQREQSINVTVEKAVKEDLTSKISASGEVKPKKNVNISAHIAGRIIKIGVEEGQEVKKDDFLLKLESTQYEASADRDRAYIRSLQAEKIKTKAKLVNDQRVYDRKQSLYEKKLISREELESAQAQYEISKASLEAIDFQIKQAQASLRSTLDNLEKTVYNSPIDGIITSLNVEEGEIALVGTMNNPGTVLMTIADLSVMEVDVEVDETDVVGVQLGQDSEVRVDAFPDQIIRGRVTEIGSSALQSLSGTEESKDFKVVITLENPPPDLKPGLSATADIITAEKSGVLTVPISALVLKELNEQNQSSETGQEEGVFVIKDDRAQFRAVEKGIMGELKIEITSGLSQDELVAVGPYSSLRQLSDDMLVKTEQKKENDS
ncbi:MAG: efflux RND transporter periplasmic adaptor subunit [Candidatus Aminicenantes bacterium]|nr:efflux RND transporter periplasmic adaptor subunit [Candidatus Aminicenantes bacterium]